MIRSAPAFPSSAEAGPTGRVLRVLVGLIAGAGLLTLSAKMQVPGPVPMTLQTLVVLVLGAAFGSRIAVASVALYVAQGVLGMPVFANTPPLLPGLAYLAGPTGGFLLGFAVAAAMVGLAADRGLLNRPGAFAAVLALADASLLTCGFLWLAFGAQMAAGTGIGLERAFAAAVQPFVLGECLKVSLAAIVCPAAYHLLRRRDQR